MVNYGNKSTHSTLFIALVLVLLTIVFISSIPVFAKQDDPPVRRPIPGPKPTPELPACPTGFVDFPCSTSDTATHTQADQAAGMALGICGPKREQCETNQRQEYRRNLEKCEAVAGCILTSRIDRDKECTVNDSDGADSCHADNPSFGPWICTAQSAFDIGGYDCSRPEPPPSPSPITMYIDYPPIEVKV